MQQIKVSSTNEKTFGSLIVFLELEMSVCEQNKILCMRVASSRGQTAFYCVLASWRFYTRAEFLTFCPSCSFLVTIRWVWSCFCGFIALENSSVACCTSCYHSELFFWNLLGDSFAISWWAALKPCKNQGFAEVLRVIGKFIVCFWTEVTLLAHFLCLAYLHLT